METPPPEVFQLSALLTREALSTRAIQAFLREENETGALLEELCLAVSEVETELLLLF